MSALAAWWQDNALAFLGGASVALALGALCVAGARAAIHKRRLAEATLALLGLWMLLAAVPMPWPRDVAVSPPARLADGATAGRVVAAVVDVAPPPAPTGVDACALLGGALLLGIVVLSIRLAVAAVRVRRLVLRATPAPAHVVAIARELPLMQPSVPILVSREVTLPFCCGVVRPCIVLPASLLGTPRSDGKAHDLRPVLLHEFAHLAQADLRGHLLFALASTVLFWNPLFWWIRREASLAAELVADDLAARHLDKRSYVRALIDLAEATPQSSLSRGAALAAVGRPTEFFRRMNMLLQRRDRLATRCSTLHTLVRGSCVLLVAVAGSLTWTSSALLAQDQPTKVSVAAPSAPEVKGTVLVTFRLADTVDMKQFATALTSVTSSDIAIERLEVLRRAGSPTPQAKGKDIATDTPAPVEGVKPLPVPTSDKPTATTKPGESQQGSEPPPAAADDTKPPRTYLNFKDTEVTKVIATISKISGTTILVPSTLTGKVTVQTKNVPWPEALALTVEQVGHQVTDDGKGTLVVSKKPK